MKSRIEQLILSPGFQYLQPYFYTNPHALRCELGIGGGDERMNAARERALEIHRMLFPNGADAIIFNYRVTDYSDTGEAEGGDSSAELAGYYIGYEARQLCFLLDMLNRYRHAAVKELKLSHYDEDVSPALQKRNRIVCYGDGKGFDDKALIDMQLKDCPMEIGLVSFENDCILSVYDDRGCDVTFASHEKMLEFYERLKPYFLAYDAAEMERRYKGEADTEQA